MRVRIMLAVVALALPANAQSNVVVADSLFREGRALMDRGDYEAACPKLSESYAQDPATGTLLALALCHERAGQVASAWVNYREAAERAKREGRADRESAARGKLALLEPKVSYLTVEVDPAVRALPGLVVKRDGAVLGPAAWGTPAPADPGEHVFEVTAPGKAPFRHVAMLGKEADKQVVRIVALNDELPAPAPAVVETPAKAPAEPPVSSSKGMPPLQLAGLIVGGAGVVTLGVSGFFGLRAANLNKESNELGCQPDGACPADALAKRDDAVSAATAATITLIGGGVLVATGATLFIVGGKRRSEQVRVTATPVVGWNGGGLLLQGTL